MLGILAGAWSLQHAVLGGQAGALLQFFQQSICTETPRSGPTSCTPCGVVPLPKSQEQKEGHSRSCWPAANARGALSPLPKVPIPVQDVPTFSKSGSGAKGPASPHHPWPAKKPLPDLSLTQPKSWQGKAHPGPILRVQGTTSPKVGQALFLSVFPLCLGCLSHWEGQFVPLKQGMMPPAVWRFPDPSSPTLSPGWLPAPAGCSRVAALPQPISCSQAGSIFGQVLAQPPAPLVPWDGGGTGGSRAPWLPLSGISSQS